VLPEFLGKKLYVPIKEADSFSVRKPKSTSPVKVVNYSQKEESTKSDMGTLFNISTIQQLVFSKGAKNQQRKF
jgi:hypothetical protein